MSVRTLTAKGQITIPKEVREKLGLRTGDQLILELDENGRLMIDRSEPKPSTRLAGLLKHLAPERPVSLAKMSEALRS